MFRQGRIDSLLFKQNQDPNAVAAMSVQDFLDSLNLSKDEYLATVRVSLSRAEILLKRSVVDIRVNNFNPTLLKLWETNMDIQYILDASATVMYIASYTLKTGKAMSVTWEKMLQEALQEHLSDPECIRRQGNSFTLRKPERSKLSPSCSAWL